MVPNNFYIENQINRLNFSAQQRDWAENDTLTDAFIDYLERAPDDNSFEIFCQLFDKMLRIVRYNILAALMHRESKTAIRLAVKMFAFEMGIVGWDGDCLLVDFKPKDCLYDDFVDIAANILMGYSFWSEPTIKHVFAFINSATPEERRTALIFLDGWMTRSKNRLSNEMYSCLIEADLHDDPISQTMRSNIFTKQRVLKNASNE